MSSKVAVTKQFSAKSRSAQNTNNNVGLIRRTQKTTTNIEQKGEKDEDKENNPQQKDIAKESFKEIDERLKKMKQFWDSEVENATLVVAEEDEDTNEKKENFVPDETLALRETSIINFLKAENVIYSPSKNRPEKRRYRTNKTTKEPSIQNFLDEGIKDARRDAERALSDDKEASEDPLRARPLTLSPIPSLPQSRLVDDISAIGLLDTSSSGDKLDINIDAIAGCIVGELV